MRLAARGAPGANSPHQLAMAKVQHMVPDLTRKQETGSLGVEVDERDAGALDLGIEHGRVGVEEVLPGRRRGGKRSGRAEGEGAGSASERGARKHRDGVGRARAAQLGAVRLSSGAASARSD